MKRFQSYDCRHAGAPAWMSLLHSSTCLFKNSGTYFSSRFFQTAKLMGRKHTKIDCQVAVGETHIFDGYFFQFLSTKFTHKVLANGTKHLPRRYAIELNRKSCSKGNRPLTTQPRLRIIDDLG